MSAEDTSAPRSRDRIPGLDVLRGLAAAAVLAFHFTTRFGIIFGHPTAPSLLVPWGEHGVEVFFVISGFAIELSLESTSSAREFLVSRALRLYPTFWAALAITFTVLRSFGLPDRVPSVRDAFLNLSMMPASLGAHAVDAVYWTLERELRFYGLILSLLVLGLRRHTVLALLVTVLVQSVGAVSHFVPHWISDLVNAHWAHLFACGALLARCRRAPSWKVFGLLAVCVASGRLLGAAPFIHGAVAVALVWLATRPAVGALFRPMIFVGKISYPLYLTHQYIGYVVMRALYARGAPVSVSIGCACAVAFAIATALHFAVEAPCLEVLRRRRNKSMSPTPEALALA